MSGQIIGVEALFLLVSAGVGFCYRETGTAVSLLITAGIAALIFLISQLFRPKDEIIFVFFGFVTVAAAWILLSAVGALPFYISGACLYYGNHSCGVRSNHTPYARGNAGTYRR